MVADLPEPAEGSDEQPDPVPLMDRSCNANILEKVLEYLTKHHEFDKTGASQVSFCVGSRSLMTAVIVAHGVFTLPSVTERACAGVVLGKGLDALVEIRF